jgi:hypothetical protein
MSELPRPIFEAMNVDNDTSRPPSTDFREVLRH